MHATDDGACQACEDDERILLWVKTVGLGNRRLSVDFGYTLFATGVVRRSNVS